MKTKFLYTKEFGQFYTIEVVKKKNGLETEFLCENDEGRKFLFIANDRDNKSDSWRVYEISAELLEKIKKKELRLNEIVKDMEYFIVSHNYKTDETEVRKMNNI